MFMKCNLKFSKKLYKPVGYIAYTGFSQIHFDYKDTCVHRKAEYFHTSWNDNMSKRLTKTNKVNCLLDKHDNVITLSSGRLLFLL